MSIWTEGSFIDAHHSVRSHPPTSSGPVSPLRCFLTKGVSLTTVHPARPLFGEYFPTNTGMELALNVAWGPISQVAVPFLDVYTATQLAVGAYGWWKARNRSVSLVQLIHGNGGSLMPALAFNSNRYQTALALSEFRGVAWFDGRLESATLPTAGTGRFGDAGLHCLRALTTALLAFYDVGSIVPILAVLVPKYLVNYDLDEERRFEPGPLLGSIREYVESVSAEEKSATLTRKLLTTVDQYSSKLFVKSGKYPTVGAIHDVDTSIVIGLLEWVLSAPSKRGNVESYPTRSFGAWSLSVVLNQIGFDILPFMTLISDQNVYEQFLRSESRGSRLTTYLVSFSGVPTDLFVGTGSPQTQLRSTARVVPVSAVPSVIFQFLRHRNRGDVDLLFKVWTETFQLMLTSIRDKSTQYSTTNPQDYIVYARTLILSYCQCVENQLSFYDAMPDEEIGVYLSTSFLQSTTKHPGSEEAPESYFIVIAVTFAALYAMACEAVITENKTPSEIDVAVYPDLLEQEGPGAPAHLLCKLVGEIGNIGNKYSEFCSRNMTSEKHNDSGTVSFFGIPVDSSELYGAKSLLHLWMRLAQIVFTGDLSFRQFPNGVDTPDTILGFHNNGIFVIVQAAVQPSLSGWFSLHGLYVTHGQPLQIAVPPDGRLKTDFHFFGYRPTNPAKFLKIGSLCSVQSLGSSSSADKIRVDLEPDWEKPDDKYVTFRIRINGVYKCSFDSSALDLIFRPGSMLDTPLYLTIVYLDRCTCGAPCTDFELPGGQAWRVFDWTQAVEDPSEFLTIANDDAEHVFVPASENPAIQIFVAALLRDNGFQVVLALKCLRCAFVHCSLIHDMPCAIIDGIERPREWWLKGEY